MPRYSRKAFVVVELEIILGLYSVGSIRYLPTVQQTFLSAEGATLLTILVVIFRAASYCFSKVYILT